MLSLALAALLAAPPPCHNAPQITDPAGDGHHATSDVLGAWWSESSGHLQAVIQVADGAWVAAHDDADIRGAGYAFVFTAGGRTQYVRATTDPVAYDYGTYNGAFTRQGATTGAVEYGSGGTVTIDVPAAIGGALTNAYVVTYDGISNNTPDWVDHAPGGTAPDDPSRGGDYTTGSCAVAPPNVTSAVTLTAPAKVTGRKTVTVKGTLTPPRAGVPVTLTRSAKATATSTTTSAADGSFTLRVPIGETTRLRAAAEGVNSNALTITAYTRVRINVRGRVVTGKVDPPLPGRVLWLRTNAIRASARTTTRHGTFRLVLKHPRRGRYQAVVIPTGKRAERATSNTGVIR